MVKRVKKPLTGYAYPKRKATNFSRIAAESNTNACIVKRGMELPKGCIYPRYGQQCPDGADFQNGSCDVRRISFKENAPPIKLNDETVKIRLYFDRAIIRYYSARAFRKKYAPFLLNDDDSYIIESTEIPIPILRNDFVFVKPQEYKDHYGKQWKTYFKGYNVFKPTTRNKNTIHEEAVFTFRGNSEAGSVILPKLNPQNDEWSKQIAENWSKTRRYYYQSDALLKNAIMLFYNAFQAIDNIFVGIYFDNFPIEENERAIKDALKEAIAKYISVDSILFFGYILNESVSRNMNWKGWFPYAYNAFSWEHFLANYYATGKQRTAPNTSDEALNKYFFVFQLYVQQFQ